MENKMINTVMKSADDNNNVNDTIDKCKFRKLFYHNLGLILLVGCLVSLLTMSNSNADVTYIVDNRSGQQGYITISGGKREWIPPFSLVKFTQKYGGNFLRNQSDRDGFIARDNNGIGTWALLGATRITITLREYGREGLITLMNDRPAL